jgi:hypothetical protein
MKLEFWASESKMEARPQKFRASEKLISLDSQYPDYLPIPVALSLPPVQRER